MAEHRANSAGADLSDRLLRLEENEAFAERTFEQLNAEVVALSRRMTEVLVRMDRVEARLDRLMGSVTELSARAADSESPLPTPPDDPHRPADQPPVL